jgi:hypothetical protein
VSRTECSESFVDKGDQAQATYPKSMHGNGAEEASRMYRRFRLGRKLRLMWGKCPRGTGDEGSQGKQEYETQSGSPKHIGMQGLRAGEVPQQNDTQTHTQLQTSHHLRSCLGQLEVTIVGFGYREICRGITNENHRHECKQKLRRLTERAEAHKKWGRSVQF